MLPSLSIRGELHYYIDAPTPHLSLCTPTGLQAMKEAMKHSSALVKAARTQARRRALANSALGGSEGVDGEDDREGGLG